MRGIARRLTLATGSKRGLRAAPPPTPLESLLADQLIVAILTCLWSKSPYGLSVVRPASGRKAHRGHEKDPSEVKALLRQESLRSAEIRLVNVKGV